MVNMIEIVKFERSTHIEKASSPTILDKNKSETSFFEGQIEVQMVNKTSTANGKYDVSLSNFILTDKH